MKDLFLCNMIPENLVAYINKSHLSVSLSQESQSDLASASGSGSITIVQSRCLLDLWSQMKIQRGENPLLSSLTWHLAGLRRSTLIHVTVDGLSVLVRCWPKMTAPVYLSLSIGLWHCSIFPQRQQMESKRESKIEATVLFNLMLEVIPITFTRISLLEVNH